MVTWSTKLSHSPAQVNTTVIINDALKVNPCFEVFFSLYRKSIIYHSIMPVLTGCLILIFPALPVPEITLVKGPVVLHELRRDAWIRPASAFIVT